jgi:hypothetical protein
VYLYKADEAEERQVTQVAITNALPFADEAPAVSNESGNSTEITLSHKTG